MNQLKTAARLLGAAILALALTAPTAQAQTPNPGYEQFKGCPNVEENATTGGCVRTVVTGGHFQMGSKDVPIQNPITLVGGQNIKGEVIPNAEGGMKPVKQQVPGGVIGLTGLDWLINFLGVEALQLFAATELAGTPKIKSSNSISLPIKIHLINPVLGNNCYVGSAATPIGLTLTTGTTAPPPPNEPITGKEPTISEDEETEILTFNEGIFVDNSFSAPGASGCTLTLLGFIPFSLNSIVNTASGLPAAAGTNETTQDFNIELVPRSLVY